MSGRVSLFVDGANMYYAQKRLGWFIDYRRVLEFAQRTSGGALAEAFYYTGADVIGRSRDVAFRDYLMHSGFTVRTKAIKQVMDDVTGDIVEKANLDIEIVIDMICTINLYDVCILMSGDGDFERALETLRSHGKRVVVVSHPDMTARDLRNATGSGFYDIRLLESQIARTDRLPEMAEELPDVAVARAYA